MLPLLQFTHCYSSIFQPGPTQPQLSLLPKLCIHMCEFSLYTNSAITCLLSGLLHMPQNHHSTKNYCYPCMHVFNSLPAECQPLITMQLGIHPMDQLAHQNPAQLLISHSLWYQYCCHYWQILASQHHRNLHWQCTIQCCNSSSLCTLYRCLPQHLHTFLVGSVPLRGLNYSRMTVALNRSFILS